jgi:hypothetical protein
MNSIATTMIKKGNYKINVYTASLNTSFIVIDSNEGYWTAFNSLGVSVIKQSTKQGIVEVLRHAELTDLELYNNQASI